MWPTEQFEFETPALLHICYYSQFEIQNVLKLNMYHAPVD